MANNGETNCKEAHPSSYSKSPTHWILIVLAPDLSAAAAGFKQEVLCYKEQAEDKE